MGTLTKSDFKEKIELVAESLQLPFQLLAATERDFYRKPCPRGWNYFLSEENGGVDVDKSVSVFVGDAAGREENWKPGRIYCCARTHLQTVRVYTVHTCVHIVVVRLCGSGMRCVVKCQFPIV